MSPSRYRLMIAVALPLLIVGFYFIFVSGVDSSVLEDGFVHPDTPAGILPGTPNSSSVGSAPSSENVSDAYFQRIFVLEEQIRTNPADTLAMRELGRVLQDSHRLEDADMHYSNYLLQHPRARQVWLDLAATRAVDEKWDLAKEAVREMLDVYPGDEFAIYNLGAISANSGDFAEAQSIWKGLEETVTDEAVKSMVSSSLRRLDER